MHIIKLRWAGFVYILISIILGVISVNSANNLLYLITAIMLGYMLASGWAGRSNIRSASVSILLPDEIYAQTPCAVKINVYNKNRFTPIFFIEVSLGQNSVLFPIIQPECTESKTLFTTFSKRGKYLLKDENIELSSTYPFNFFIRYWPISVYPEAIIFPYPLVCEYPDYFHETTLNHLSNSQNYFYFNETDIMGVRPYIDGDSMKRIHWKSSARTGKLKTRLYETSSQNQSQNQENIIDLNKLIAENNDIESSLSMAAYLIIKNIESGLSAGIKIGMKIKNEFIFPASGHEQKKNLLTKLALYK